ncbi:PH domain-containing protein [Candidatus Marithrix sp. Canyon 246]|uniref:PH domain-containing protein n=1 Tax=Candidatus Marithrix sp. Canyon 246 TaxID=1827136 RepID=UPI00084A1E4D|nr:PH domain-containing protein [Candidatus Marithrix sp. Canyon 246]
MSEEKILYDSVPSMVLNRPISYLACIIAMIIGIYSFIIWFNQGNTFYIIVGMITGIIGLTIFVSWWITVINTRLTITEKRLTLREGILSKNIHEVFVSDIRSVQIQQTLLQRILGTGTIDISGTATVEAEIKIDGIPKAYDVKKCIDEHRHKDI